ncbi:ArsR family transcriptional regulator [Loktanella sp. IMCC34160]|uniref:ArsR/SmtB family transcription factor n=1 Tax=Loktanella sp. IMCC34160 TaxID=2510646 RepID=UPI00101E1CDF|nr:winged helix-turn-helix domain-containing protein [Loktanella sp. IMCC34160]RYG93090.1 ArsR family transcriptional regulator [Loktanella sp. IMCC34160]
MNTDPQIVRIGAALSDQSRARMLCQLMDGRAHTNKELAHGAGISPQTASGHLAHLVAAGLVITKRSGRFTYHRIAGSKVAEMLETLSALPLARPDARPALRRAPAAELAARCCYNHLAGRLGVAMADALVARAYLTDLTSPALTEKGRDWAARQGLKPGSMRPCLDWSERRYHLSGPFATTLLRHLLEQGQVARGAGREIIVTDSGRHWFDAELGIRA